MPLIAFWQSTPSQFEALNIEQIVAMAGDGNLKDASVCSDELRAYFSEVSTEKIATYIEHCLSSAFSKSGLVFQDLVNELARRLDYGVENGKYQGTTNSIGYDGIWRSSEGHTVVAEVKTTDAYTVKLDVIANYRSELIDQNSIENPSSILIIVARQDTGELEALIRGSRHAWDIRLISADALIKLVQLKENSDTSETGLKIRSLITPLEFTRLDGLVDVMFTTATDVETSIVQAAIEKAEIVSSNDAKTSGWQFTSPEIINRKRSDIVDAMSERLKTKLIRNSPALYWDASHSQRLACSISKRYDKGSYTYWYAYHPRWDNFLAEDNAGYFLLGCVDLDEAYALPIDVMRAHLPNLNTTTTERSTYWHVHLSREENETKLVIPNSEYVSLQSFAIKLSRV